MDFKHKDGGIELIGDRLLLQKLEKLKQLDVRTSQISRAFNRASKPLRDKARSNARQFKRTGTLWKSIKMIKSKQYKSLFWVGPARGRKQTYDAWYGYFLEAGTGMRVTTKGAARGRVKPKRYMERAYMATKNQVRYGIIRELNILIKKAVQ